MSTVMNAISASSDSVASLGGTSTSAQLSELRAELASLEIQYQQATNAASSSGSSSSSSSMTPTQAELLDEQIANVEAEIQRLSESQHAASTKAAAQRRAEELARKKTEEAAQAHAASSEGSRMDQPGSSAAPAAPVASSASIGDSSVDTWA